MKYNGISVVIPCYNREKTIKDSIESVLSQNYPGNIEIIVSDDGSTDHSLSIVEEYGEQVILLRKPSDCRDQGVSGARNRGILAARNEYICFLDSDDYYLPGYLPRMAEVLDANPDFGYAFSRCKQEIRHNDGSVSVHDWTRRKLSALGRTYHALYQGNCINTNSIFIRKALIDQVGLFDRSVSNGEDSDMWIRVSEFAKGTFVDFYGSVYRVNHSNEQLTSNSQKLIEDCHMRVYAKAFQRFFISGNDDSLRLLLIVRRFLYMRMTKRLGLIFTVYRFTVVNLRLLCLFPKTYWVFLAKML